MSQDDVTQGDTGATATTSEDVAPAARCPVMHHAQTATGSMANQHWWPEMLNLRPLARNPREIDPMGDGFDYRAEIDLDAVKVEIETLEGQLVTVRKKMNGYLKELGL